MELLSFENWLVEAYYDIDNPIKLAIEANKWYESVTDLRIKGLLRKFKLGCYLVAEGLYEVPLKNQLDYLNESWFC